MVDESKMAELPDEIIREEDIENMSEVAVIIEDVKEEPKDHDESKILAGDVKIEIQLEKEELAHSDYQV